MIICYNITYFRSRTILGMCLYASNLLQTMFFTFELTRYTHTIKGITRRHPDVHSRVYLVTNS
jgi:hypothetical protein